MKAWVTAALAAVLISGCGGDVVGRGRPSPAVATVNGSPITLDRMKAGLKLLNFGFENSSGGQSSGADAKIDLLSQMIDEEMYLQEAGRLGISASGDEVDRRFAKAAADYPPDSFDKTLAQSGVSPAEYKEDLARKITVEKLIDAEVYSRIKVDGPEVRKYYEGHVSEFQKPLRVRARQIVVEKKGDADAILGEIRAGGDFASLARARSFSPDGAQGGDLGFFSKGDMPPEFDAVVFHMKPGEVSPVVKTPYGYHIFKVEKVLPAEKPDFREAEPEARRKLVKELGEDAFEKWREALKAKASVKVNFDVLGSL